MTIDIRGRLDRMADEVYRRAFERAREDLEIAVKRKAQAEADAKAAQDETMQLRRTVAALALLLGENVEDSMGLTQAIRLVFQDLSEWTPVRTLKEQIESVGVSLADLKNPDASVQSVLNRLVASGELETANKRFRFSGKNDIVEAKAWRRKNVAEPELSEDDIPF